MSEKVTKEQHDFFRSLYEEEERTSLQLEGRAKVYLGVISALLATFFLKAKDASDFAGALHIRWVFMLLEAFPMTLGLILVLWSLRIRNFEAVTDGPKLLETYEDDWPAEAQFYEDRVVDYAVASSINRELNNESAAILEWASWCMAVGVVYLLVIVLYAIWRVGWQS